MGIPFKKLTCVVALLAVTGCASSAGGGDQLRNTVYSTHRLVQNLDKNLGESVTKLNETSAELVARIDASDRETRRLASLVEENQVKLNNLQRNLDQLTTTLYRHFNLTPPASTAGGGMSTAPPPAVSVNVNETPLVDAPTPGDLGELAAPGAGTRGVTSSEDATNYYRQALDLYQKERLDEARERFTSYLELFPGTEHSADAQYWKAHCSFRIGDYDKAIIDFAKLRDEYPSSIKVPIAMHNQAVAYSRLGQNDRAEALFRQLIAEYPNDVATEGAREKLRQLEGR